MIATGQAHRLSQMQKEGLKRKMFSGASKPIVVEEDVPRATSVPQAEPQEKVTPPLLCFPLAAFLNHDPDLPPDFRSVERTGRALKSHERPDGAVFLGLYEIPGEHTGIVVFGPPDTPSGVAIQVSQQYRQEQHALESGIAAGAQQSPLPTLEPIPSLVS